MFDITEEQLLCPVHGRVRMLSSCLQRCPYFPCKAVGEETYQALVNSRYTEWDYRSAEFIRRRIPMKYLGVDHMGTIKELPKDFDIGTGAQYVMENHIRTIYVVTKEYEPQVRLIMKPAEERRAIREEEKKAAEESQTAETEEAHKKRRRAK